MTEDGFRRVILNANEGVTNVIDATVIRKDLQAVMDKLFNILKGHYGPLSTFAAIDSGNVLDDTQFTKDGINIIRDIEFAAPQEDWVRKTIAFIGRRVESSVGDGTTSAMMFTCAMLKHMLEHIDEVKPISYTKMYNTFLGLIAKIEEHINDCKVSPFIDNNSSNLDPKNINTSIVRDIVYNQVYTSSHGDIQLAKDFSMMYSRTPPELWERMIYERLKYESDKRYEIIPSGGQYTMTCDTFTNSTLNKDFCTWYESKDCKFMILNNALIIDTDAYNRIMEVIDNEISKDYPLVVLCHSNIPTSTYQELITKLDESAVDDKPVAIFTVNSKTESWNPSINDFISLQLLCDKDITKINHRGLSVDCVEVDHASITWKNNVLTIDNLYTVPDEYKNDPRRHQFIDGKHAQFVDYVVTVKNRADAFSKGDLNPESLTIQHLLYKTYAKLTYRETFTMRIGGNAHDNLAMVDIVDDCIRASSRSLKNGIVFGNNKSLYLVLKHIECESNLEKWLVSRMLESFDDIAASLLDQLYPGKRFSSKKKADFVNWWFSNTVDLLNYDCEETWNDQPETELGFSAISSGDYKDDIVSLLEDSKERLCEFLEDTSMTAVVCQPANTDISMLKRFAEVAIKYVLTGRIIVRNGAYVDKPKGAKK